LGHLGPVFRFIVDDELFIEILGGGIFACRKGTLREEVQRQLLTSTLLASARPIEPSEDFATAEIAQSK
jgi:hypothetical protein